MLSKLLSVLKVRGHLLSWGVKAKDYLKISILPKKKILQMKIKVVIALDRLHKCAVVNDDDVKHVDSTRRRGSKFVVNERLDSPAQTDFVDLNARTCSNKASWDLITRLWKDQPQDTSRMHQ